MEKGRVLNMPTKFCFFVFLFLLINSACGQIKMSILNRQLKIENNTNGSIFLEGVHKGKNKNKYYVIVDSLVNDSTLYLNLNKRTYLDSIQSCRKNVYLIIETTIGLKLNPHTSILLKLYIDPKFKITNIYKFVLVNLKKEYLLKL